MKHNYTQIILSIIWSFFVADANGLCFARYCQSWAEAKETIDEYFSHEAFLYGSSAYFQNKLTLQWILHKVIVAIQLSNILFCNTMKWNLVKNDYKPYDWHAYVQLLHERNTFSWTRSIKIKNMWKKHLKGPSHCIFKTINFHLKGFVFGLSFGNTWHIVGHPIKCILTNILI